MIHTVLKAGDDSSRAKKYFLFVGSYTQTDAEGIYVYEFDANNGSIRYLHTVAGVENPSYLAIDAQKDILVAVNETMDYNGEKTGAVSTFSINPQDGRLTLLSQVPSGGGAPCYVSLDRECEYAFVANYMAGNVAMFPFDKDRKLLPYSDLQQHRGSGPVSDRQKGPHAHTILLDNSQRFALAADLGTDEVISYAVNYDSRKLHKVSTFSLEPGSGPRHIALHPNGRYAYIISELANTITASRYDPQTGALTKIMTAGTLPEGFKGESYCADIHLSKDGRFVYGSNRGHDSITIFKVDEKTGKISYTGNFSVKGAWPRNFMIDPTGNFLLVANQHSDNIVVFRIDKETGKVQDTGVEVKVSKPVCLKMMERP